MNEETAGSAALPTEGAESQMEFNPLAEDLASNSTAELVREVQEEVAQEEAQDAAAKTAPEPEAALELPQKDDREDEWIQKFERLSRRDAEIRRQQEELKAKEERLQRMAELERELERDPQSALAKLGVKPDKLFETQLERQQQQEREELAAFKKQVMEELQQAKQQNQQLELKRQGDIWESRFSELISDDKYHMVRAWDPDGSGIREHVANHYHQTGELLPPDRVLESFNTEIKQRVERLQGAGLFGAPKREAPTATAQPKPVKTIDPEHVETPRRGQKYLDDEEDMMRITEKYAKLMRD